MLRNAAYKAHSESFTTKFSVRNRRGRFEADRVNYSNYQCKPRLEIRNFIMLFLHCGYLRYTRNANFHQLLHANPNESFFGLSRFLLSFEQIRNFTKYLWTDCFTVIFECELDLRSSYSQKHASRRVCWGNIFTYFRAKVIVRYASDFTISIISNICKVYGRNFEISRVFVYGTHVPRMQ